MVHMPPRRTSLQVDVSRVLYCCIYMPVCLSCRGSCVHLCLGRSRHAPPTSASVYWAHNPQKALADCGAASLCLAPWETPVCSRLFHGAKTFGDYILNRNKEKKETKKNSPGYLSLSCAPLGKCRLSLGLWYQAYDSGT